MNRRPNSFGPILGYHGCDRVVAEEVLSGNTDLKLSENRYDWLGSGIYFWVDSPQRALGWAIEAWQNDRVEEPYIVGAHINPGLCLNFTDYGVMSEMKEAYKLVKAAADSAGIDLPKNETLRGNSIYLKRSLDCLVIEHVHAARKAVGEAAYDSVLSVFEEGKQIYKGSGIREHTHIQVAVRNPGIITAYFRVKGFKDPIM